VPKQAVTPMDKLQGSASQIVIGLPTLMHQTQAANRSLTAMITNSTRTFQSLAIQTHTQTNTHADTDTETDTDTDTDTNTDTDTISAAASQRFGMQVIRLLVQSYRTVNFGAIFTYP